MSFVPPCFVAAFTIGVPMVGPSAALTIHVVDLAMVMVSPDPEACA